MSLDELLKKLGDAGRTKGINSPEYRQAHYEYLQFVRAQRRAYLQSHFRRENVAVTQANGHKRSGNARSLLSPKDPDKKEV